jgi:MinD superfamily P-loop ATPase
MIITVASGKGGTGKTTIAVNMALSLDNAQLLDCDVEEPNCSLFLKPEIKEKINISIPIPEIDETKCSFCGKCAELCEYNALAVLNKKTFLVKELCHGCGVCTYFCPEKAIKEVPKNIGIIEKGSKENIEFVSGRLNIGEAMAPPLIKAVKKNIKIDKINILDAPPGTSCPVVASVIGSDYVILVTEPTPFGLHDLKLAVALLKTMNLPFGVVVNRSDLGDEKVFEYCREEKIPIHLQIPFDRKIAEAYSKGITMVELDYEYKDKFKQLYEDIMSRVRGEV